MMDIPRSNLHLAVLGVIVIGIGACSSGGDPEAPASGGGGGTVPPPPPPGGASVVFGRDMGGNDDLFLIKNDGSGFVTLANGPEDEVFARLAGAADALNPAAAELYFKN